MVRSMYSGVSGLKAHQTRMDTIGNNIANVNTYGFKSGRTTFRDIYYQTMSSASGPTAAAGGTNPSQVGYGSKVGSVDLMMGRSTFTMTDEPMDLAIDGDGFFQVMDGAGNIYYTRAGMLGFDAMGNLIDSQGNFVLGVNGDPTGKAPGSDKIRVNLPMVQPNKPTLEKTLNNKDYTLQFANDTKDGNISFNFTQSDKLTDGVMAEAKISANGIVVTFNANETFNSWDDVNNAINRAITEANGGVPHVAGDFTITYNGAVADDPLGAGKSLTGKEITSSDYGIQHGSVDWGTNSDLLGMILTGKSGAGFSGSGDVTSWKAEFLDDTDTAVDKDNIADATKIKVSMTINGTDYVGYITKDKTGTNTMRLQNGGDSTDYIEIKRPAFSSITDSFVASGAAGADTDFSISPAAGTATAKPSEPSKALGFSETALSLMGGTAGGEQDISDMTNIYIAPNGVITGIDSVGAEVLIGRIDLATFANASGLDQVGSSNFAASANSGIAQLAQPGSGGSGKLVGSSLELSNVDLSREFSDMITTQRGYQANSRIITVSDTMLEELINLKR